MSNQSRSTNHQALTSSQIMSEASGRVDSLTEFTLFPKLAPEIQNMIWGFVSHQPREVVVHPDDFAGQGDVYHFESCCTVPSILHTNRQARKEGLKYYKLKFGDECSRAYCKITVFPEIYFNSACDRCCLIDAEGLLPEDLIKFAMNNKIRSWSLNMRDFTSADIGKLLESMELLLPDINEIILYADFTCDTDISHRELRRLGVVSTVLGYDRWDLNELLALTSDERKKHPMMQKVMELCHPTLRRLPPQILAR